MNSVKFINLLNKLQKENKTVFLLGDFNINHKNYEQDSLKTSFLISCLFISFDPIYSNDKRWELSLKL